MLHCSVKRVFREKKIIRDITKTLIYFYSEVMNIMACGKYFIVTKLTQLSAVNSSFNLIIMFINSDQIIVYIYLNRIQF